MDTRVTWFEALAASTLGAQQLAAGHHLDQTLIQCTHASQGTVHVG